MGAKRDAHHRSAGRSVKESAVNLRTEAQKKTILSGSGREEGAHQSCSRDSLAGSGKKDIHKTRVSQPLASLLVKTPLNTPAPARRPAARPSPRPQTSGRSCAGRGVCRPVPAQTIGRKGGSCSSPDCSHSPSTSPWLLVGTFPQSTSLMASKEQPNPRQSFGHWCKRCETWPVLCRGFQIAGCRLSSISPWDGQCSSLP